MRARLASLIHRSCPAARSRAARRTTPAALLLLGAALVPGLGHASPDASARPVAAAPSPVQAYEEDFTWPAPPNPAPAATSARSLHA
ncbi:hypothetical protein ACWGOK_28165 [Streptomyces eurythermus]